MSSTAYDDTIKKLCGSDIERVEITNMDTDQDGGDVEDEDRTLNNRIMNSTPTLNGLYHHITTVYAAKWKIIGSLLGLPIDDLVVIEVLYSANVRRCNQMLKKWLEVDTTASWGKMLAVIKSPAVSSSSNKGIDEVMIVSNYIKKQAKVKIDEILPSKQLSSVMLIRHTKMTCYEPPNKITTTKDITEISTSLEISPSPCVMLVLGAPGIGKTTLVNKMCYQWANGEILQNYKFVFLLQLQDPAFKEMSQITHLLQLLCQRGTKFPNIASACVNHLLKNFGKEILFIFDGFDEFAYDLQKNSGNVIVDILKQKVLPQCSILVTSRPCASEIFDFNVTINIEILGSTRGEVESYVHTAMEGEPHKISNLMNYLNRQPVIDCFVPFNMAMLVYLYKCGLSLPTSSAELYNTLICLTVSRHLGILNIAKLTDLPEPYYKIIQQLAKLSYETLNKKWSFTRDEIETACPNMIEINNQYGLQHFGLLQEVKHISHCTTYNFIHYSVQEFLAAWHISTLQSIEVELRLLKEYFWRDDYFKVFSMYVALTKGQKPSFQNFLTDNKMIPISYNWLKDPLKCLRLFHCFYEAGDTKLCHYLEQLQTFKDETIELSSISLSVIDIECITVFLTQSSQRKWQELNLHHCGIGDRGIYMLHCGLLASITPSISMLQLSYNNLTKASSSLVGDIVIKCNAKKLKIDGNHSIGEKLCTVLSDVSKLECLHLVDTKLSSIVLNSICMALTNNNTLKELLIAENNITDDACYAISTALQSNSCLAKLWMWKNPIHSDTLISILEALQVNNTLAFLGLPSCPEVTKTTLESLQEVVNEKRESRECQVRLMINFM